MRFIYFKISVNGGETVEEWLANLVCKKYVAQANYSEYERTEIIYGWTVLFYNLFKVLLVLITSLFLYSLEETLISYISFCLLRISGFGYHAKNNFICNLSSILLFSIAPSILSKIIQRTDIHLNIFCFLLFGILCVILILLFAPSFTENSYTKDTDRIYFLKFSCLITFMGLLGISLILPAQIGLLMMYGMGTALLFLLPNYTI